jgi:hypothetical protein
MRIHWVRVVLTAFLLEAVLIALTIPLAATVGIEGVLPYVPIMLFVTGFLACWWIARKVGSLFVLHGILVGVVATLIYLGLVFGQFGSLMPVLEMYGPFLFFVSHAARFLGCAAGAYTGSLRRRAELA